MNTRKIFEIVLYNTDVRKLVEIHETHPKWDDGWADGRYIELQAASLKIAIKKIRQKYPRRKGFKILAITEIPDFTVLEEKRFI